MVLFNPHSRVVLGSQSKTLFTSEISGFLFTGSSLGRGLYTMFILLLIFLNWAEARRVVFEADYSHLLDDYKTHRLDCIHRIYLQAT